MIENTTNSAQGRRMITVREVMRKTTLSRQTIWRMARRQEFPAGVKLSGGRVAWWEDAVDAFLTSRAGATR
jgi:predicted DNA-binding transcriptional regulator AlpA